MRRRDFLLSLAVIPFMPAAEPLWDGTITHYRGETKFYISMGSMVPHPICPDCPDEFKFTGSPRHQGMFNS